MSSRPVPEPRPETGSAAGPGLARGHAFDSLDLRTVEVAGADWAMEMAITPLVVNSSGVLQGGLMATLIDLVAGTALLRGELVGQRGTTSEMHISYLAAARVGPVRATAHILRRGKRSAVIRVDVHDLGAHDLHVATSTLTFAVRPGEGPADAEP
ncbi:MAG: PaaI family thioesterase [Acidimicrobiales bacterium]